METQDFEAMIQRFSNGDRSLEVLAPLNEAAWEGFHDPWEQKPFFLTEGAEVFLGDGLPVALRPCAALEAPGQQDPATRRPGETRRSPGALPPRLAELIANYMEVQHWDYVREENGEIRCTPPVRGMAGQDLTLRLAGGGNRFRNLWFHMASGFQVPEEDRGRANALCVKWNRTRPNVCARLEVQLPSRGRTPPRTGTLSLHIPLPAPPDLTMRTLVAFLGDCMEQAGDFWMRARVGLLA